MLLTTTLRLPYLFSVLGLQPVRRAVPTCGTAMLFHGAIAAPHRSYGTHRELLRGVCVWERVTADPLVCKMYAILELLQPRPVGGRFSFDSPASSDSSRSSLLVYGGVLVVWRSALAGSGRPKVCALFLDYYFARGTIMWLALDVCFVPVKLSVSISFDVLRYFMFI